MKALVFIVLVASAFALENTLLAMNPDCIPHQSTVPNC